MAKKERKAALSVDVLVRQQDGVFVAQGLQFDVAVQARNEDELKERFVHAFAAYLLDSIANEGTPLTSFRPAPRRYWDMFLRGQVLDTDLPVYVPSDRVEARASFRKLLEAPPAAPA